MTDPYTSKNLKSMLEVDDRLTKIRNNSRVSHTALMMANTQIPVHRELNSLGRFSNVGVSYNPYNRSHTAYDTPVYYPPDYFNRGRYQNITYR